MPPTRGAALEQNHGTLFLLLLIFMALLFFITTDRSHLNHRIVPLDERSAVNPSNVNLPLLPQAFIESPSSQSLGIPATLFPEIFQLY